MILSKLSVTTILVSASLGEAAKITPLVEDKPELKTLTQTVGIKPKAETPSAHFHKVKKVDADTPAKKSSDPETRIVGGNSADYGEYQYYAQLLYSTGIVCGGSLIAPNVVLSAAHCYDAGLNKVSVGTYDFSYGYYESGYSEHSGITHVAIHPDYVGDITGHTGNMEHDIMLLRLDDEFTQFDPITLNSNAYKPATGDYLTVIGLGLTDPDSSYSVAGTLQEVELQTVAPNQCFPPDHPGIGVYNDHTEFCASDPGMNGGKMSCQGDSGGPIFEINHATGEHIQMGVVSWGSTVCAEPSESAVYSRVSANMDFIEQTVCDDWGIGASFCGSDGSSPSPPSEDNEDSPESTYPPADGNSDTDGNCGYGETYILFEIGVDSWGGEVSWDLRYGSGSLIQSDSGFADGEVRSYDGCLSESASSCYYLTIYDSHCDGMGDPFGGKNPYIYIMWGTESYLDNPSYTCDISFELCH